jgi:hypothetical protein
MTAATARPAEVLEYLAAVVTDLRLDPDRRLLLTSENQAIFNSFPIRYYEPGTRRVARPNGGPVVLVPQLVTPALPASAK